MNRIDVINKLSIKANYESYLEIGVYRGYCFDRVNIEDKEGVDPNPIDFQDNRIHVMTSDDFFASIAPDKKYDFIFIDGLHDYNQVLIDISNSLNHLSENGTIALHDCNPPSKWHQRDITEFDGGGKFNGTVWKGFVEFRSLRKDLNMFVVDCDWGVGVIQRANGCSLYTEFTCAITEDFLSYEWLEKNRIDALNLIDVSSFTKWLNT